MNEDEVKELLLDKFPHLYSIQYRGKGRFKGYWRHCYMNEVRIKSEINSLIDSMGLECTKFDGVDDDDTHDRFWMEIYTKD